MDVEKQLTDLAETNYLVFIFFYADWCPHYEWIQEALDTYEKRTVKYVQVNIEENKMLADSYNVESVPTFILMHHKYELWRKISDITIDELRLVLSEF